MLNTLHNQRGVTLIELMIVLTIAAILLTIGAPSFSDWIQNMRIRNTAESLLNGLQLSRAEAVRLNAQVKFEMVENGSWTTGCETINANCPAVIQSRSSNEGSTDSISVSANYATLVFNGLGRASTLFAGGDAIITISNPNIDNCISDAPPGTMRCLQIVVSPAGQIRMCNPALPLPQGCA